MQYGQLETVEAMVALGADVDLKDMEGGTPLRLAESYGKRDVADFLRPLRDSGSGRWSAVAAGGEDPVEVDWASLSGERW